MSKPETGLIVDVYRDQYDGTNGGISSKYERFVLLGVDAPFTPDDMTPALKIVKRFLFGRDYYHLEPIDPCPSNQVGYMFGGNFAYSSDSRFPNDYPLPIHDRSETQEQYDTLSR